MVESTVLEQQKSDDSIPQLTGCHVLGRVRNDSLRDMNVTLKFSAFGKGGTVIATGGTDQVFVTAGGRSNFRAPLIFILDCDDVSRLEVLNITAEPA